jgi:hypothetical protein
LLSIWDWKIKGLFKKKIPLVFCRSIRPGWPRCYVDDGFIWNKVSLISIRWRMRRKKDSNTIAMQGYLKKLTKLTYVYIIKILVNCDQMIFWCNLRQTQSKPRLFFFSLCLKVCSLSGSHNQMRLTVPTKTHCCCLTCVRAIFSRTKKTARWLSLI